MKPLSEQLTDLAARAKKSEDFVDAARAKNRAYLDDERKSLETSISSGKARMSADAAVAQRVEFLRRIRGSETRG